MDVARARIDNSVRFGDGHGGEIWGKLIRLGQEEAVFEIYSPFCSVEIGQTLQNFTLFRVGTPIFSGETRVQHVVSTCRMLIVSVKPTSFWLPFDLSTPGGRLAQDASQWMRDWETGPGIVPAYQLAVSSIRAFLTELSQWSAPIDVAVASAAGSGLELEQQMAEELYSVVQPRMRKLFDRFEEAARTLPAEAVRSHRVYAQRELHPLILCAPLVHRSFTKPLGYAGDYEMVNMLLRNRMEGPSMYAKVVNAYFLRMDVAEGHRNRITKLADILEQESARVSSEGRNLRVLNVGCGPADEICRFIRRSPASQGVELTLLDFNRQTLDHAKAQIDWACEAGGRGVSVTYVERSVYDVLKDVTRAGKKADAEPRFDLVYCAGLFDYLSDRVCARMLEYLSDQTAPGGLALATNVHSRHSAKATLDHLAEWSLILRTEDEMIALAPEGHGAVTAETEAAGTNVFLEIRKPVSADGRSRTTQHRYATVGSLRTV